MTGGFEGFSEETVAFLLDLKENNDQGWFNENRDLYEKHFLEAQFSVTRKAHLAEELEEYFTKDLSSAEMVSRERRRLRS